MKRLILLGFMLSALIFTSCKKDKQTEAITDPIKVEKKNMALYNKATATWCGSCGTWGWVLNEDLLPRFNSNAVCVSTYGSGSSLYYNQTAGEMCYEFAPAAGWPAFCVNGVNKTGYVGIGVDTSLTNSNCINAVNNFSIAPVVANSGFRTTIKGDSLSISTRTEFFQDGGTAEYFICAYITENHIIGYQYGQEGDVEHNNVLRGSAHSTTWGQPIISATSAGSYFEHTFVIAIDTAWNMNNINVFTAIWKKNGTHYIFVNAYKP